MSLGINKLSFFNRKRILLFTALIIVLFAGLYIGRSWVRGTVVPKYVTIFYKSTLERDFNNSFSPINKRFADDGIKFAKPDQDTCYGGATAYYQDISETVPCIKDQQSINFSTSSSFEKLWTSNSSSLTNYLTSHKWVYSPGEEVFGKPVGPSINNIFTYTYYSGGTVGGDVFYFKYIGNDTCELRVEYSPDVSHQAPFSVDESCELDVPILGGYYQP